MDERKKYKKKRQQCALCSLNYSKREYLAKHMSQAHGEALERKPPGREPAFKTADKDDPRPFKCPDCIKEYKKSKHLARHRRESHVQKMCTVCKKSFPNLAQHMQNVHAIELPKNFQCDVCSKAFLTKSHLQSHMRIHRRSTRNFACDVCDKRFGFSNDLRKHMRTHSLDRSILCDICGDAFKSPDTLKSHMRRHTGERPYKCTLCSKAFSTSNSLDIHNRTHTGEKPYACEYCQKGFSDPSTLTVHKRLHTNENPFICHLCGKTTKQASNLRSHYKHMHKNDVISGRQIRLQSRIFSRYSKQEIDMHLRLSGDLITLLSHGLQAHNQEEREKRERIETALQTFQPPQEQKEAETKIEQSIAIEPTESEDSEYSDNDMAWQSELDESQVIKTSSPAVKVENLIPETNVSKPSTTRTSQRIATKMANDMPIKIEPVIATTKKKPNKPSLAKASASQSHQIESVFIENDMSDSLESLHTVDTIKKEVKKENEVDADEVVALANVKEESCRAASESDDDDYWTNMYDDDFDSVELKSEHADGEMNENVTGEAKSVTIPSTDNNLETNTAEATQMVLATTKPTTEHKPKMASTVKSARPADSSHQIQYKNVVGKCAECNKKFNDLTRHQIEAHSTIDKPFECYDCRKTYKKYENLKMHMVVHTNERNFICHFCGKAFFLGSELRKHIFNRHQDVRPYGCDQCKKTFKSKHALNKHSVVHSGVKPYVCAVCSERYAALSSLRIHERRHTGDKPFTCTYCGKAFADSSTHRQHVRIHTGEKPYICKLCGRACAQAGNLKSHYRHYHKVIVRNVSMFQDNDFPVFERLPNTDFLRFGGTDATRIEE